MISATSIAAKLHFCLLAGYTKPRTLHLTEPLSTIFLLFHHLCLGAESSWIQSQVPFDRTVLAEILDVGSVDPDFAGSALFLVFFAAQGGEAPVLRNNDLLAAGELVH